MRRREFIALLGGAAAASRSATLRLLTGIGVRANKRPSSANRADQEQN